MQYFFAFGVFWREESSPRPGALAVHSKSALRRSPASPCRADLEGSLVAARVSFVGLLGLRAHRLHNGLVHLSSCWVENFEVLKILPQGPWHCWSTKQELHIGFAERRWERVNALFDSTALLQPSP